MKNKQTIFLLIKKIQELENDQGFISARNLKKREKREDFFQILGEKVFENYKKEAMEYFLKN